MPRLEVADISKLYHSEGIVHDSTAGQARF